MRRFLIPLFALLSLTVVAFTQTVTMPPPAGTVAILCAYNTVVPTPSTGFPYWVQCDSTGKLRVVATQSGAWEVTGSVTQSGNWNVGGFKFQLASQLTVQNAAYVAGNSLGGTITATGAARTNGGSGLLNGIRLKSNGASTNTIWIYAWSKAPSSTCTDKTAFVSSSLDNAYALVGFPTSVVLGGAPGSWDTATLGQVSSLIANFKNQDTSPGTALYLCLVTAAAVTPLTASDLSINLSGSQD